MKIAIIGTCSSGKSTLAHFLGTEMGVPYFALDDVFVDYSHITRDRVAMYSEKKIKQDLGAILKKKDWVIEGVYDVQEVFARADLVILVKHSILRVWFWQWKRLLSDAFEWSAFGLRHNLILSQIIWQQYFSRKDCYERVGICYPTMKFYGLVIKKFAKKSIVWSGNNYFELLKKYNLLK